MTLIQALNAFQDAMSPTDQIGLLNNPYWTALIEAAKRDTAELVRLRAEILGNKRVEVVR